MKSRGYLTTLYSAIDCAGSLRTITHTYTYSTGDATLAQAMRGMEKCVYQHQEKHGFTDARVIRISHEVYCGDQMLANNVLREIYFPVDTIATREVRRYEKRPTLRNLDVMECVLEDIMPRFQVEMVLNNLRRGNGG